LSRDRFDRGRGDRDEMGMEPEMVDRLIHVNRVAKVVKGGRRFSFNAIVAVGNRNGQVGVGLGKANEISDAIRKATESARKQVFAVPLKGTTLPHEVLAAYGAARVLLRPASPGTGVIAGSVVRTVLELGGVQDVLTKSLGSNNPHNLVRATVQGLQSIRGAGEVARRRGMRVREVIGMTGPSATEETHGQAEDHAGA